MSDEPQLHDESSTATNGTEGPDEFICPRCRLSVTEEFYGPCQSCRTTLRATLGGDGREVAEASYEPKMNVTPNAVATKD